MIAHPVLITQPLKVEFAEYCTPELRPKFTWLKKSLPVVNVPSAFWPRPKAITFSPVAPGPVALPAPNTSNAKLGDRPPKLPVLRKPFDRFGPIAKLL